MGRIAIFAAMDWECRPVLHNLRDVRRRPDAAAEMWLGRSARAEEVWVVKTGLGERRATEKARRVAEASRFDLFLSTGCAGALAPDLRPGDLVIAPRVVRLGDGESFASSTLDRDRALRLAGEAGLAARAGDLACSETALATPEVKRAAAARTQAIAVEMEGTGIAAVASASGIRFLAVRSILDDAQSPVEGGGSIIHPELGRIRPLALIAYLARRPGALRGFAAARRMMNAAQQSLEQFFAVFLAAPEAAGRGNQDLG